MSTHSTIILTNRNEHIYHEQTESEHSFNKWIGWNIYFEIDLQSIYQSCIKDGILKVKLQPGELKDIFGEELIFIGSDVVEVNFDYEGMLVVIKGGSYTAKEIEKKKQ